MSPRPMLYRMELDDEFGEPYYVEATTADIVAWLREQGAVDVLPTNSIEDEEFGELLPALHVEEHGLYLVAALPPTGETL